MLHAQNAKEPRRRAVPVLPAGSVLLLTAAAALALAIALGPVDPPPSTPIAQDRTAAPAVAPTAHILALPGPLPALRYTAAPARANPKVAVARKLARPARPQADIIARWESHSQALLHIKVGFGRALRAVLLPQAPPVVAVAVPAEPDEQAPSAPARPEPPATTEPESGDEPQSEDTESEPVVPDDEGTELPADDEEADDPPDDAGDDTEEDDGDLRPVRGGKV